MPLLYEVFLHGRKQALHCSLAKVLPLPSLTQMSLSHFASQTGVPFPERIITDVAFISSGTLQRADETVRKTATSRLYSLSDFIRVGRSVTLT